ncbi:sensor histidine kinase [Burkholderia gladioli]|uniref:sensor histidine kinase n=1 Tax=Burkholderia gladioli TaxID=28095 RepID=UPI00163FD2D6|nr:histidine kinase [Burkholderia gladioli]
MDMPRIAAASASALPEPGPAPARSANALAVIPTAAASSPSPVAPAPDARLAAFSAELAAELAAADETARRRLARELHDGLGADLTGLRFAFANLDTWLPEQAPEGCRRALALAQQALDAAFDSYRRALDEAAPALDAGLVGTLSGWVGAFGARTRLRTSVVCAADARLAQLAGDNALAVFRVAQEALANIARHARAQAADVRLEAGATHLELIVADDGRGFAAAGAYRDAEAPGGRGLGHMRARCAAFGGTLAHQPREGGGTVLRARFAWDALLAAPRASAHASGC